MAVRENLPIPADPDFSAEIGGLNQDDPVHYAQMNAILTRLLTNDVFLEKLASKMVEKTLIAHVLDSTNTSMVLGADQAPALTALLDTERERITKLNSDLTVLNTNLNNRAGLILCGSAPANDANLLFVENRITFFETIVSTLNTPYKANLTQGLTAGIAITYMSAPGFGIQLHLSTGAPDNNTGAPKAFMRAYSNYIMGAWH
nr:MAG TPA: hypothetical protein [Caudoviricetes sp.]